MLSISTQRNLGSSFFNLSIEKFSSFVVRFSMFNCSFSVCPLLSGPFDKTDCPSDSLHTIPFSLPLVNTFFQLFLKIFPSFSPFVNYPARFCAYHFIYATRCGQLKRQAHWPAPVTFRRIAFIFWCSLIKLFFSFIWATGTPTTFLCS